MKNYLLKLADDNLIMGQSLSKWCGHGPYLEEDIALTNIALDYLGQANNFYHLATNFIEDKSIDDLAFLRYENEYLNAQLCELPNGDYAQTIAKIYFFSNYQSILYQSLTKSTDANLSGLAQKSLKEVNYHLTHTRTWMEIFANGTAESNLRLSNAIDLLWEYTEGLFHMSEGENLLSETGIAPNSKEIHSEFLAKIKKDFTNFGIEFPQTTFMQKGSRKGIHTEYMGHLLCEMQYMQRAYPNCEW